MKKLNVLFAAALLIGFGGTRAHAQQLIVNAGNPVSSVSADEVSRVFLKKQAKWPNGTPAAPVDQSAGSAVRAAFSQKVHGRAPAAIEAYWQQQIFSGGSTPPPTRAGDDAVIAFVRDNPGAVGYVSAAAQVPAGVKAIPIR